MARRRARMKAQGDLHAIAERILLKQLKLDSIAQARQMVKEGRLELNRALVDTLNGDGEAMDVDAPEMMDVDAAELPAAEEQQDLDASLLVEDESASFAHQFTAEELRGIDASGDFVSDLPKQTQMALLHEMKAAHRGHVGALSLSSPKRLSGENYSNLQVEQLVLKGGITRRIETVRGEIGSDSYKPIASDPNVRYRLTSPPPTPIRGGLGLESSIEGEPAPQVQRVVMSSTNFNHSPSPPPASQPRTQALSQHSAAPPMNTTTNHPINTPPPIRSAPRARSDPLSPSRLPSASISYYRLPQSSGEQRSLVSAMVELDPDMALAEVVSDDEDDPEDVNSVDGEEVAENSETAQNGSPASRSSPAKKIPLSQTLPSRPSLPIPSTATSPPSKSRSPPKPSATVEIVAIEDSEDSEEDFLEVQFEDVGDSPDPPVASVSPPAPESIIEEPTSTTTDQLHSSTHRAKSPVRNISSPSSPQAIPSASPVEIGDDFGRETNDFVDTPFGADVVDVDEEEVAPRVVAPVSHGSSTPHRTSETHTSFLSTSQRTASSSDETQMLIPRVLSFSVDTSQASQPSAPAYKAPAILADLDMSTESQHPMSLNHSIISEEEIQRVSTSSFDDLEAELRREVASLEQEARQGQNQAVVLTSEAVDEAKELLRLFGIPFVQSPSEADAQCAALQMLGLVDGIVSDDSDILVFGGDVVFRHAFSSKHDLELYNIEDIQSELGLDHDGLVFLALLLGGDYAEGLAKVGPRAGLDIATEFSGPGGMLNFKCWLTAFQEGHENYDRVFPSPSAPFLKKYGKLLRSLKLPESFPNPSVLDAYQNPSVDPSKEAFTWGWPNLAGLRQFALDKFGWTKDRVDGTLLPLIKIYTTALGDPQPRIETFFSNVSIHGYKPAQSKAPKPAKAPKHAGARAKSTASLARATAQSTASSAPGASENDADGDSPTDTTKEAANRKKRGRAKRAAVPSTVEEEDEAPAEPSPKRAKTRKDSV